MFFEIQSGFWSLRRDGVIHIQGLETELTRDDHKSSGPDYTCLLTPGNSKGNLIAETYSSLGGREEGGWNLSRTRVEGFGLHFGFVSVRGVLGVRGVLVEGGLVGLGWDWT